MVLQPEDEWTVHFIALRIQFDNNTVEKAFKRNKQKYAQLVAEEMEQSK